jgi:hypothetical protein
MYKTEQSTYSSKDIHDKRSRGGIDLRLWVVRVGVDRHPEQELSLWHGKSDTTRWQQRQPLSILIVTEGIAAPIPFQARVKYKSRCLDAGFKQ